MPGIVGIGVFQNAYRVPIGCYTFATLTPAHCGCDDSLSKFDSPIKRASTSTFPHAGTETLLLTAVLSSIVTHSSLASTPMDRSIAQSNRRTLPQVSFTEKWESFKPIIEHLYIVEDRPVHEIQKILKDKYEFDAKSVYISFPQLMWRYVIRN